VSALIFDLDGTLIDASRDIHFCAAAVLEEEGLPTLDHPTISSFIGGGVEKLIQRCLRAVDAEETPERRQRMYERFLYHYPRAVERTVLFPKVRETLEGLRDEGYRLALCTNKPQAPTHAVLKHLEIDHLFDAFAFGDEDFPKKPDPAPVRHLIDQLHARRFLYVGDSEVDAQTAEAAGLPMALYTGGHRQTPVAELYHDAVFTDYDELPGIAARLAPRPE
jgi:phosphoglycolate phosphatase